MRFSTVLPLLTILLTIGCNLAATINENSRAINASTETIQANTEAVKQSTASMASLKPSLDGLGAVEKPMLEVAASMPRWLKSPGFMKN